MLDVLDELSTLSLMFQQDSFTILGAVDALRGCYIQLVHLGHEPGPLMAEIIAVYGKLHGHQLKAYSITTPRDIRQSVTGKYRFMNLEYDVSFCDLLADISFIVAFIEVILL